MMCSPCTSLMKTLTGGNASPSLRTFADVHRQNLRQRVSRNITAFPRKDCGNAVRVFLQVSTSPMAREDSNPRDDQWDNILKFMEGFCRKRRQMNRIAKGPHAVALFAVAAGARKVFTTPLGFKG